MTPRDQEELAARYRDWPEDRLLLAATISAHEYEPEALEVMREVLRERGVAVDSMPPATAAVVADAVEAECALITNVRGLDRISWEELNRELSRGARFVAYQFCYSYWVATVKRQDIVHFIPGGRSRWGPALKYAMLSLLLGWWGLPWGPIWTIQTVIDSLLEGGHDVTEEAIRLINHDREYNDGRGIPWLA